MNADTQRLENEIAQLRVRYGKAYDSVKVTEKMIHTASSERMKVEFKALLVQRVQEKEALGMQLHDTSMRLKEINSRKLSQASGSAGSIDLLAEKYGHLHRSSMSDELKAQISSEFGVVGYLTLTY